MLDRVNHIASRLVCFTSALAVGVSALALSASGAAALNATGHVARSCPTSELAGDQVARSAPDPVTTGSFPAGMAAKPGSDPTKTRIVVVEWRIKPGRECDFLEYWSTRSTIPNRDGLIGEFLSEVDKQPWVNWAIQDGYTTFYNVGIWREAADFEDQIGKHINLSRPPLDFEATNRIRIFLAPERWRVGSTALPVADAAGVR
jgi:hypothetical protein